MSEQASASPVKPEKPPLKARLKQMFDEYGPIAIGTYFGIFFVVLGAFALAIQFGVHIDGAAGTAGTLAAAYVATKLTQPLRILGTLVLTPLVAKVVAKFRKPPATPAA